MNLKAAIIAPGLWGLSKSDFQKIGRGSMMAMGLYWHSHFKARHFQLEAFQRYGYRFRAATWEAKKQREHPESGGRPLVFTGESEALAMAQNRVKTSASDYQTYHAEVTVSAPKLNYRAGEATRITDDELAELSDVFAKEFESGMVAAARENGTSSARIELWQSAAA